MTLWVVSFKHNLSFFNLILVFEGSEELEFQMFCWKSNVTLKIIPASARNQKEQNLRVLKYGSLGSILLLNSMMYIGIYIWALSKTLNYHPTLHWLQYVWCNQWTLWTHSHQGHLTQYTISSGIRRFLKFKTMYFEIQKKANTKNYKKRTK